MEEAALVHQIHQLDDVGIGERLVQGVLTDHLAQCRLCDLVDGVEDAKVGDRGNVDADVVAGFDALRLDRQAKGCQ